MFPKLFELNPTLGIEMKHNCDVAPHIVNDLSLQLFGGSFIRTSKGDSLKVLEGTITLRLQI